VDVHSRERAEGCGWRRKRRRRKKKKQTVCTRADEARGVA
jgi:hypothetical protein